MYYEGCCRLWTSKWVTKGKGTKGRSLLDFPHYSIPSTTLPPTTMAQGNLKLAKKAKSTTQKKVTPKDMKKGRKCSALFCGCQLVQSQPQLTHLLS